MMNLRLRPVGIGVLAVLGLAGTLSPVAAEPTCNDDDDDDDEVVSSGEADLNYIYFRDDNTTSMSGKVSDIERARRHKQPNERIVWFRNGGQEYVIRDPATLKEIDTIWRPVNEIGDVQGKLGKQVGELGRRMGELGSQQGLLGTRQGTLATREATLAMRESSDSLSDAQRAKLARQRAELQQQARGLEKQMRALEKPMRELETRMEPLTREMEVLGKKMEVAAHKATGELRAVFRRTIASGIAKQVK
jgi:bla regulator protein BlaR1